MDRPPISVVVPVLNGAAALPALLGALAAQEPPPAEIVVVDNGSTDRTASVARLHDARVVQEPRRGRARARNAGVAATASELIAFTDADCLPQTGWLAAIAACLAWSPLAAGPVELVTGEPPNRWERLERLWRFEQERNVRAGWAATANLGVRREAFEAAGGFDESYRRIGEDVDFCLRAAGAGLGLVYCESAVVRHRAEAGAGAVFRRAVAHGWSSQQHSKRWPGVTGWEHWRHPRPVVAGDWALRRFGEQATVQPELLWPARLEYAGRVAGSALAALRGVR
jgi:GT2 family glycosyltransferase